jgi:hypothetical protein
MKVSGPTQIPSTGTSPTDDGAERAGVKDVGHADGARGVGEELRTIDGAPEARLSEPAAAPHQPHRGVAVADLAREVDAGKLSPQLALERVMERVLDRHIAKSAPAATREHIRTALLDALESDPLLTEKLARLG